MNNQLTKTGKELPTLEELNHDIEVAFKNDKLNLLLNQPMPTKWIKEHPTATREVERNGQKVKEPIKYLPIDKVEFLLTRIFQKWNVEVISFTTMFQSVAVHVRLHYLNPITGEMEHQDGLGAVAVQTDKGKSAADLAAIKSDAVMKALPAAESYAIKDAAEKIGKIFGKDLNRPDEVGFSATYKEPEGVPEELKLVISEADAEGLNNIYDANPELHNNAEFNKLIMQRKSELK